MAQGGFNQQIRPGDRVQVYIYRLDLLWKTSLELMRERAQARSRRLKAGTSRQ